MSTQTERELILRKAIIEAIAQEFRLDPATVYIGEDVGEAEGVFKQTEGLYLEFGKDRVFDTPISEAGMFGLSVGAAMSGLRPIVEMMFGDFLTLIMDQLVNHAAKMHYLSGGGFSVPLVMRTAVGVGGVLGSTHSQSFYSWPANVPGLKVVVPATPADAKGLMTTAIRDNNPVLYFEDRMTYNLSGPVPEGEFAIPFGEARVHREGTDVTIVAVSRAVHTALKAAEMLGSEGISAEVVDPRTLVPLDKKGLIESVCKTGRAIVVDGGHEFYGVTGELAAIVAEGAFDYLEAPVMRLGAPHHPVPCSKPLEVHMVPNAEQIVAKVKSMYGR